MSCSGLVDCADEAFSGRLGVVFRRPVVRTGGNIGETAAGARIGWLRLTHKGVPI